MEEKRKVLEERIKSFICETQFFRDILADLNNEKCGLTIKIGPNKGISVKVAPVIPHWVATFAASNPNTGGFYSVKFSDGKEGMVKIKTDNTFSPCWCELTEDYKDKIFLILTMLWRPYMPASSNS